MKKFYIKTCILKFLVSKKILINGYVNPLILFAFIFFTPAYYVIRGQIEKNDYYLDDQEIEELVMNQYGNDSTWYFQENTASELTPKQIVKPKYSSIFASSTPETTSNLDELFIKAKKQKTILTNWDLFRLKVFQTARNFKKRYPDINATDKQLYDWSMKTFSQESGFNANAANPHSSARGLFQAMANVRKQLGMPNNIRSVPLMKQVEYYEKYVCMQIDNQNLKTENIGSALDWYLIVFYPNLSDKADHVVFAKCCGFNKGYCCKKKGWKHCNYHANSLYDLNKDGTIYKSEIGCHLIKRYEK